MLEINPPLFTMGRIVATSNAINTISQSDIFIGLHRHQTGDWGDVCDEDRQTNDLALVDGTRLLSVYHSGSGNKFWIITESDRSSTTVLLPEDY